MNVVVYDKSNNRIKDFIPSAHTPSYTGRDDVLFGPNLSSVEGVPLSHWMHDGGAVREMTQAEKDTLATEREAAEQAESRANAKGSVDSSDPTFQVVRALGLVVFQSMLETRNKINEMISVSGVQVDPLPNRTWNQLVAAVKNKIDSGEAG